MTNVLWMLQTVLFGYPFLVTAIPNINVSNTLDGENFANHAEATLTCSIDPYNGIQKWIFDSATVSECGFASCVDTHTEPDRFEFSEDLLKGVFVFTILELKLEDNNKVIECFDGSDTAVFNLSVIDTPITRETTTSMASSTSVATSQEAHNNLTKKSRTRDCKCWVKYRCFLIFLFIATPVLFLQTWLALFLQDNNKNCFTCLVFLLGLLSPGIGVFVKCLSFQGYKGKCNFLIQSKPCVLGICLLCLCMITSHILPPVLCIGYDVHTNLLYIIGGVSLFLIYLYGGFFTWYIVHESGKEELREQIMTVMEREGRLKQERKSVREAERNMNRERGIEMTRGEVNLNTTLTVKYQCDECTRGMSIKSHCIECHRFLCNSCDACHACKGTRLRHLQHEANAREADIPCAYNHKSSKQTHGYCLTCWMYLCTECLIIHQTHILLWIPQNDLTKTDRLCCYKGHTDLKEETALGYCIQCDMYVCVQCTKKHDGKEHKLIMHHKQGDSIHKCEHKCECMAECFHLNSQRYLCSDCYEHKDMKPVRDRSIEDVKLELVKNQQKCMIHKVFGMGKEHYTTDVCCLKCSLYLCKDCFKHHKRLKEDWIRTHENNLFTCKNCQAKRNVFPVECLLLDPVMLLCAECFESGDVSSKDAPKIGDENVMKAIRSFVIQTSCQIHIPPFQKHEEKIKSSVFCLMCKTYMCKDCFRKHRRFKDMTPNSDGNTQVNKGTPMDRPLPSIPSSQQSTTATIDKRTSTCNCMLKIFGFIPVVGILFTGVCILLEKHCNMVTTRQVAQVPPSIRAIDITERVKENMLQV